MSDVENVIHLGSNLPIACYIRCFLRNNLNIERFQFGLDDCYTALKLNKWKKENHQLEDLMDEEKTYNTIGSMLGSKLGQHDDAINIYENRLENLRNNKNANKRCAHEASTELLVNLGNECTIIKNHTAAMSTLKKALSICIENDKNVVEVMTNIGHVLECQRHHNSFNHTVERIINCTSNRNKR